MLTRRKGLSLTALLVSQLCVAGAAVAQETTTPPPAAPPAAAATPTETVGAPPADAAIEDSSGGKKKQVEEEVVVTGSRVRRKDLTTAAPVAVISREQIAASGIASIGDFLQQIPEQTGALNTNVNNGGDGETTISLRNLGSNRTLVLVDGKRWVNGGSGAGSSVDLNTIPTSAIERIEILKDGASAVYGSDAIGGVVNIITRRRPNGTELSAYVGLTPHGDSQQYDLAMTTGITGEKGAFLFSANYFHQESLFAGTRDWANKALAYDYASGKISPGGSGTVPSGRASLDPSTCTTKLCQDLLAAYGPGKKTFINDGNSKDPVKDPVVTEAGLGSWRKYISSGATNDLFNYQAVNYLITPSTRISLFANGDYHLTNFSRAYVQGSFTNRQSSYLIAPEPFVSGSYGIAYSKDNPFNPFGVDVADARRRLVELSGRTNGFDLDTFRVVTGVDGTLPAETGPLQGTFFDVGFMYGRTSGVTTTGGSLNTQQVGNALGPAFADPTAASGYSCGTAKAPIPNCTPVNLFSGQGPITPDQAAALGAYKGINQGFTQIAMVNVNLSKELFSLASVRPVAIAAGYEHRREYGGYFPNPIAVAGNDTDFNGKITQGSFNVNEGYAELDIPIISGIVGADDLELQLAARLFNYSTFGTDNTYKIGGRWRPIRDVTVRGTYSTAFRAPNVGDLYGGQGPSAEVATDPCANTVPGSAISNQCLANQRRQGTTLADNNGDTSTQINSTVGGNPALKPETAKIGTVGIVFEPTFAKGFSATVDYWTVSLSQDIGAISTPVILAGCYPASTATPNTPVNTAYCDLIQRSASTGQLFNVNDLNQNVGTLTTSGIDFAARYFMNTDVGRFGFLFDLSYLLAYDQTFADGTFFHSAGNYDSGSGGTTGGVTPRVKFNAGVNYSIGGFSAGLRGRFIGGFSECAGSDGGNLSSGRCTDNNVDPATNLPFPSHSVPAYVTFDLNVSYLLRNPLGNTTLSAGVRNLADASPPQVYNSFLTYADPTYDFAGRFVYFRLGHQF